MLDTISVKEYEPKLPQINLDSDSDKEDEPHIKIVRIYRFKSQVWSLYTVHISEFCTIPINLSIGHSS